MSHFTRRIVLALCPAVFFALLAGAVYAANQFPTSLNNWSAGQRIESDWANALEAKLGVNGSAVTTSLDYILKNAASLNPGRVHSSLVNSNNTGTALTINGGESSPYQAASRRQD